MLCAKFLTTKIIKIIKFFEPCETFVTFAPFVVKKTLHITLIFVRTVHALRRNAHTEIGE